MLAKTKINFLFHAHKDLRIKNVLKLGIWNGKQLRERETERQIDTRHSSDISNSFL